MKRALRVAIVLGTMVATFVACFNKPDEPIGDNGGHLDGGVDAKVFLDARDVDASTVLIDAPKAFNDAPPDAPLTCDSNHRDDFTSGMAGSACSPWGTATFSGASTATRSGGVLTFDANSAQMTPGVGGYCDSNSYNLNGVEGTSIEFLSFQNASMGSRMWFYATLYSNVTTYKFELVRTFSGIEYQIQCPPPSTSLGTMTPPAFPFYVRWRGTTDNPTGPGNVIMHLEYSTNGNPPWMPLGSCAVSNQNLGSGFTEMGTTTGSGNEVMGVFDNWNTASCIPP